MKKTKKTSSNPLRINLRYNREENDHDNYYIQEFGTNIDHSETFDGLIKCKLVHDSSYSLIVPDLIFIDLNASQWIQPLAFIPNRICKFDDKIICDLDIDIASSYSIHVRFENSQFVRCFKDGSQLFRCQIRGPRNLKDFASGTSVLNMDNSIDIDLFHHTSDATADLIKASKILKASKWNIQGNKRISNLNFIYFSWIDKIEKPNDLKQIAMASDAEMQLRRDCANIPAILPTNWKTRFVRDIVVLKVYRESTKNRTSAIRFKVCVDDLAPQHLFNHLDDTGKTFYEITHPFIHRMTVNCNYESKFDMCYKVESSNVSIDYLVIGDACDLEGLMAPYDEDVTDFIAKIERTNDNFIDFWFKNGNKDLYTNKQISKFKFETE